MEMYPVSSRHIEAVGYDEEQGFMLVRFKSGDEYTYQVSYSTYEAIKEAGSVGKALNACGVKGDRA